MNAYLMAAGYATRLRPITEKFPKCLLKVKAVPMLEHWLNAVFSSQEFENVYVNVHHCADEIEQWVANYSKATGRTVHIIDERAALLGTAGTLFWHADPMEPFLVGYTDTYSEGFFSNLKDMALSWKENPDRPLAGLIGFNVPEDRSAGSIETDFLGTVTKFSEKSDNGLIAWAGMMFARGNFVNQIRRDDKDLARDVFPRLLGKIAVIAHVDAYDIGRGIEEYEQAHRKIRTAG